MHITHTCNIPSAEQTQIQQLGAAWPAPRGAQPRVGHPAPRRRICISLFLSLSLYIYIYVCTHIRYCLFCVLLVYHIHVVFYVCISFVHPCYVPAALS